jgi:tetratricopeptide (TPR) repeat protein
MMNEEKLLTVARYIEGDMEVQEKESFEAQLQGDRELQTLVAAYQNIHQTLKMKIAPAQEDQQVESTLAELNRQYFGGRGVTESAGQGNKTKAAKIVPLGRYLKWLSIAAVLIIGLFIWAPWSADLYEKYAISKEMSVAERGVGQAGLLEKAAALYNTGDYPGARKLLEKEYQAKPEHSIVAYYYGITLIETGSYDKARTVLTVLYNGESVFKFDAAYSIGLSYIKQKNRQQALNWLKKIPQGTSHYAKARELTQKLQ